MSGEGEVPESIHASTSPKGVMSIDPESKENSNTSNELVENTNIGSSKTDDKNNKPSSGSINDGNKQNDVGDGDGTEDEGGDEPELVAQTEFEEVVKPMDNNSNNSSLSLKTTSQIAELSAKNVQQLQMIKDLQQAQIVLQNEKEEELRNRLSDQVRTISDKNRTIESLQVDVERRSDAIRSCGEEIVALRRENVSLTKNRDELSKRLENKAKAEENEMKRIKQLVDSEFSSLEGINIPSSLLNQMRILTHNFQAQNKTIVEKEKLLAEQQNQVHGLAELSQQNNELQRVNVRMSKQVAKMGKLEDKLGAYKSTVAMQEKVIAKLEGVIEARMKEEARRGPAAWAKRQIEDKQKSEQLQEELNKQSEEFEEKENEMIYKIEKLTSALQDMERRVMTVESERDAQAALPKEDPEQVQKIKMQDLTIKALKDQIRTNARESQKEISDLKIKLFEHEHNAANDSDSDDDFDDDVSALMSASGSTQNQIMSKDPSVASLTSGGGGPPNPRLESLVEPLNS